jgi:large repetitive protein
MIRLTAQKVARILTITLAGLLAVGLAAANAAPAFGQAHGTWTRTGNRGHGDPVKEGIEFYTATLLQSGQVLVAGGSNPDTGKIYANAQLYNPATGSWRQTGSMSTPRQRHTATLLANGEVLVTGGSPGSPFVDILDTAELYNPSTGTWTTTGNMTTARENHNAVLLENGEVLVTGGNFYTVTLTGTGCEIGCEFVEPIAAAELYNPSTGTFKATGSMKAARTQAQLTLLPNGEALIAGGCAEFNNDGGCDDQGAASCTAELFSNGHWSLTANLVQCANAVLGAALLPNGDVLIEDGNTAIEFYDPSTNVWQATLGPPSGFTFGGPLASLANGKVLVTATVFSENGNKPAAALYDPSTDEWTPTGSPLILFTETLTRLLNGQVLGTIGQDAQLYTP